MSIMSIRRGSLAGCLRRLMSTVHHECLQYLTQVCYNPNVNKQPACRGRRYAVGSCMPCWAMPSRQHKQVLCIACVLSLTIAFCYVSMTDASLNRFYGTSGQHRSARMHPPCPHCDQPDTSLLRLVLIGEI